VARFITTDRWTKKELRYQIVDRRDFGWGSGMTSGDIERLIQKACDAWSPHCGIVFKRVDRDPDFTIGWSNLGREGEKLIGGLTDRNHNPKPRIRFNDDVAWTAQVLDKNYMNFLEVVMHELGHMIGMYHSTDPDAIMYDKWDKYKTPLPVFIDLRLDDTVGARVFYSQPPLEGVMALQNTTDQSASYKVYVTHPGAMNRALGEGEMPQLAVTCWREEKDVFNVSGLYRIVVSCGDKTFVHDDLPPNIKVCLQKLQSGDLTLDVDGFWGVSKKEGGVGGGGAEIGPRGVSG
jgi:hypothetical protein